MFVKGARRFRPTLATAKSSTAYTEEAFAHGTSSVYFDQMYEAWRRDPESVHASFRAYFENVENGVANAYQTPPTLGQDANSAVLNQVLAALGTSGGGAASQGDIDTHLNVMGLIRAYWWNGHERAKLDPLELEDHYQTGKKGALQAHRLDHKYWGFSDSDLEKSFTLSHPTLVGFLGHKKTWKLGEIIQALENTYCNKIGAEFMHIQNSEQVDWIRNKLEG